MGQDDNARSRAWYPRDPHLHKAERLPVASATTVLFITTIYRKRGSKQAGVRHLSPSSPFIIYVAGAPRVTFDFRCRVECNTKRELHLSQVLLALLASRILRTEWDVVQPDPDYICVCSRGSTLSTPVECTPALLCTPDVCNEHCIIPWRASLRSNFIIKPFFYYNSSARM